MAPLLETPVPEIVKGSATFIPPEICKVAPLLTVVPEEVFPKAFAWVIARIPLLIFVSPE